MKGTKILAAGCAAAIALSWAALGLPLAGCFGYVQGDGGPVVVAEPDLFWFGGYGDGGGARDYAGRGAASRGDGGHGGGHGGGHAGGGGGRR